MVMDNNDKHRKWVKGSKCSVQAGKTDRAARYNNTSMQDTTVMAMEGFAKRLAALRMAKGISAREMSLSLGMTANYINSIESGENFPSMAMFFEICEYFRITPRDFFAYTDYKPGQDEELKRQIDRLEPEDLSLVLNLVKRIKK